MRLALEDGSYLARSIISSAQNCINLYAEKNPASSPFPLTHYLTPGLVPITTAPSVNAVRCTYRASNGSFYTVIGNTVYSVGASFALTPLGTITAGLSTPVSMQDNGLVILIADGSSDLWAVNLADSDYALNSFGPVTDPSIYGADRVDYLDTFLLLNRPGTNQWYVTLAEAGYGMFTAPVGSILGGLITAPGSAYTDGTYANQSLTGGAGSGAQATITVAGGLVTGVTITIPATGYSSGDLLGASIAGGTGFQWTVGTVGGAAFDPLDIAAKVGYPDPIVSLIVMHREIWLIGALTTEVWYNAGAADFAFQIMPGVFIEHGCIAKYSACAQDLNVYWISQDEQGNTIAIKGNDYSAKRISTHAIENTWQQYSTVADAIGFAYQEEGHTFVIFTFPSANATWVFDEATELWHQRAWTDSNGNSNRIRANCYANAYGVNIVGDWQNGQLYNMTLSAATDGIDGNGLNPDGSYPIVRKRSWPALLNENKRIVYNKFIADFEVGEDSGAIDGSTDANPPLIYLRWSDDRGRTYGNRVEQSLGAIGQYETTPTWWQLGMGRGRVFELAWSVPAITALNGAWVDVLEAET